MCEKLEYCIVIALLSYHSIFDLKVKRIPKWSLSAAVVFSFLWAFGKIFLGTQTWGTLVLSLLPGMASLAMAVVTRQQIGFGDGWELIVMGNMLGAAACMIGLAVALLVVFFLCVILLLRHKVGRNTEIPFVPFLCAGTIVSLVLHFIA